MTHEIPADILETVQNDNRMLLVELLDEIESQSKIVGAFAGNLKYIAAAIRGLIPEETGSKIEAPARKRSPRH